MINNSPKNLTFDQLDKITGGANGRFSRYIKMKSVCEFNGSQPNSAVQNRTWFDRLNDYGDSIALGIGLFSVATIFAAAAVRANGDNT